MKLRKHREDVKDLRLQGDAHVQEIAKRYQHLYLAVEYGLTINKFTREEIDKFAGKNLKRVLKDAKE
jgi:hypothetical protein